MAERETIIEEIDEKQASPGSPSTAPSGKNALSRKLLAELRDSLKTCP